MTWFKLDDGFFDHPKVVQAGKDARDLWLAAGCYSARELTDGFIAAGVLPLLAVKAGVRNPQALAQALTAAHGQTDVGLFEVRPGGYAIHDYLKYNPSREAVLADREKNRLKQLAFYQRTHGGRTPMNGHYEPQPNPVRNQVRTVVSNGVTTGVPNETPVPVPHPVPHEAATQTEDLRKEAPARAPAAVLEQARTFAIPKPGLAPGSPQVVLSRALATALNCDEPTTTSERRKWGDAIREMLHATPAVRQDELPRLVARFEERNTVPCTPQGIVNQLAQLRSDQPPARSNGHARPTRESPMDEARRRILERREAAG